MTLQVSQCLGTATQTGTDLSLLDLVTLYVGHTTAHALGRGLVGPRAS